MSMIPDVPPLVKVASAWSRSDSALLADYRPTMLEAYVPTPAEEALYLDLMADLDAREATMAGWADDDMRETIDLAFADPLDRLDPCERIEAGERLMGR